MKTILVPIDFSDATAPVIAAATSLARATGGRLVLLNAIQPPFIASDDLSSAQMIADLTRRMQLAATQKLARWKHKLKAARIGVDVRLPTNGSVPAILGAATELSADYIVLGSHGHGALHDLLVGSTTSGVLKRARCPVVVVPISSPKKQARRRSS